MNKHLMVAFATFATCAFTCSAEEMRDQIQYSELPAAVRKTMDQHRTEGTVVEDVDREVRNGKTRYEIEYRQNGKKLEMVVNEKGELLEKRYRQLDTKLSDLPKEVRKTVNSRKGQATVGDIDKMERDGRTIYEVELRRNGKFRDLLVAANGDVIPSASQARKAKNNQSAAASIPDTDDDHDWKDIPKGRGLSGANKVEFDDLPASVKQTIKAEAGSAEIEDVDRGSLNGRTVYQAAFKKNGQHKELQVAEDGTIINDPAGASKKNKSSQASPGKVKFDDTPEAVQRTIREQAGNAEIEDIDRETKTGRVVYEAGFKKDGRHTEIRVSEDGTLLK